MKYLNAEERYRIREWILDETEETDIRLYCDEHGWFADVGGLLVEGESAADVLRHMLNVIEEA